MGVKRLINCPACRFANRYGDPQCVICKAPLPRDPGQRPDATAKAPPAPARPAAAPGAKPPAGAGRPVARKGPPPPAAAGIKPPARPPAARPGGAPDVRETAPMRTVDPDSLKVTHSDEGGEGQGARVGKATPTTRLGLQPDLDRSKIVAWMCCDPLPPIPLGGGKAVMTIGRHHDCDLVLPHKEVSRRHAVVKVRGTTLVLEDEGSSNGCFVNGQRQNNGLLRVGDVITIGPYEVEIKSNESMVAKDEKSETKTNLELTSVSRLSPQAAMTGKLQDVPLAEVLQGIEFNKKSGTLTVMVDKTQQGALVVQDGVPMFAHWGDLKGDEAVLRMLTLFKGRFTFTGTVEPGERAMRSTLTALLLEASRRIDEGDTAPTDEGSVPRPAQDEDEDEEDDGFSYP